MRYRLRTLLILLALIPPLMAISWSEWLRYSRARALRFQRQTELAAARQSLAGGSQIGSKKSLSNVRRAQLNLSRQDESARRESTAYRLLAPK